MRGRNRLVLIALLLVGMSASPAPPAAAAGSLEVYLSGLDWPVALAFPSDGRIFFAERFTGRIRIVDDGVVLPQPLITLADTATGFEQGLLGLALDPRFPTEPFTYAYQTFRNASDGTTYNRVVRIAVAGNVGSFDRVVIDRIPAAGVHNGGILAFGPDEKLYAVDGDATNIAAAQDLARLNGKTMRINPDGSVPTDNPFVTTPGANPYVYTYGHRNMFGLAFHPATGAAFVTENGPACNDEVNLLVAGRNYGWGPSQTCSTPPPPPENTNQDGPNPVLPIAWYASSIAPTNAVVYGGSKFPDLRNDVIFGDWNTGSLRHLELAAPDYDVVVSQSVLLSVPEGIVDVEVGPDDAIWFTTPSAIYRYFDSAAAPTASFAIDPPRVNPGAVVTFDASASTDPDGSIVAYEWNFGDGASATGVVVAHAYANPGTYAVTLRVIDNETYWDSATGEVIVNAPPQAVIAANPNIGHIGLPIELDASASTDRDGTITSYRWEFGDGGTANGVRVLHAYSAKGTFTVILTVVDSDGVSGTGATTVSIRNRSPVIASSNPSETRVVLEPGQNRTFSVAAEDPDGDVLFYTWHVNGAAVESAGTSYDFAGAAGTFVVNVTVTDGEGFAWREWTVTVGESAGLAIVIFPVTAVVVLVVLLFFWRRRHRA